MIKGLFTSASGMVPHIKRQEVSANNIANAGTPGFKKDMVFTQEMSRAQKKFVPRRSDWEQPMIEDVYTDYAPGNMDKTGNTLDLAIEGDGFFVLEAPDGTRLLTRSGSFNVDADGFLVFSDGFKVLGEGGPIEVGDGLVSVAQTGEIQSDGAIVGRIVPGAVTDISQLQKIGDSLFALPEGTELIAVERFNIRQGFIETSNVDIVREMIDMMVSFRAYEANSKAVRSQDESLGHLFQRVGGSG
ncbi:MAG: flagellar basal-body rod protein FlgF [candidate division Zixibacteria bacterium]|nr:flagellar basal-body rod protein FlgF [candidate division Zixibacteria bacterium]MDH3938636.1 flagellar basal-body rod protein FlgF [candidate division Zixibacteria bacterium]MDH4034400.1 flagellar basal-body rod protein FlgF [candidate division Zixibacteria bacterium]